MVSWLYDAEISTGGRHLKEKAVLKSVIVALSSTGVGSTTGNPLAAEVTATTLNGAVTIEAVIDDAIRGLYPSQFTELNATAHKAIIYKDVPSDQSGLKVKSILLTTCPRRSGLFPTSSQQW